MKAKDAAGCVTKAEAKFAHLEGPVVDRNEVMAETRRCFESERLVSQKLNPNPEIAFWAMRLSMVKARPS